MVKPKGMKNKRKKKKRIMKERIRREKEARLAAQEDRANEFAAEWGEYRDERHERQDRRRR
jgi:hypothetical protein